MLERSYAFGVRNISLGGSIFVSSERLHRVISQPSVRKRRLCSKDDIVGGEWRQAVRRWGRGNASDVEDVILEPPDIYYLVGLLKILRGNHAALFCTIWGQLNERTIGQTADNLLSSG